MNLYEACPVREDLFNKRVVKMLGTDGLLKEKAGQHIKFYKGDRVLVATWNGHNKRGTIYESAQPFLKEQT